MTAPERPARSLFRTTEREAERTPLRVLIVEDSEEDTLLLLRELRRGGYEPLHERVDTPEAMNEALSSEPWDVVISDYYMPHFRAPDALALLRRRGSDAPFVIVSGKVGEELAVEAMKAGAHDYIMKNNMTRLCATIERGLEETAVRRERERAEEALRQAEEKYRSIFENSTEGIFQSTIDGRILTANPALARIFGYSSPEELVATLSDVASQLYENPEDRVKFSRSIRQRGIVSNFETRIRRKDGSVIWISINARALRNSAGQITGYEGMVEDITERKQAEEELRRSLDRLVALHEAGHILGSTLEPEEIGTRLLEIMRRISGLTTAVISWREENERLNIWRAIGLEKLGLQTRYPPEARDALEATLESSTTQVFPLPSGAGPAVGLYLPLRARERSLGVLEVYGPESLAEQGTVEILESLTNQAASALENARLYGELAEREKRLEDLVGKLFVAQEEERRRVAYEVHDGMAQIAAAAHQHLQAFAQDHPPASQQGREDLDRVSKLVRQTVGEARLIIADLRPTALDDLGLEAAIRLQLETLHAKGWQISYESNLDDERLPTSIETALFRVAQEALNNIGKHAHTRQANLGLERLRSPQEVIRLSVRDYGSGFSPDAPENTSGPGERVGLSGMRERVALLGGNFQVASRPGAGTLIVAEIPLREPAGDSTNGR